MTTYQLTDGWQASLPAGLLDGSAAGPCDEVSLLYHSAEGTMVIDALTVTGHQSACGATTATELLTTGVVTATCPVGNTIAITRSDGTAMVLSATTDAEFTGINVGDVVSFAYALENFGAASDNATIPAVSSFSDTTTGLRRAAEGDTVTTTSA